LGHATRHAKRNQASNLPLEIKATLEVNLDYLNPRTDYAIAWPSAALLA
jgi:hypothetical protein